MDLSVIDWSDIWIATWETLVMTGVCLLASLLALQKVRKLEPAAVFR